MAGVQITQERLFAAMRASARRLTELARMAGSYSLLSSVSKVNDSG